ncbi:hypothetical protein M8044_000492 [Columbia Basin potato purple top phytoplasma]|uniref:Uncharacterized protein n=1 Tax=Columbia Basin potato purple top phytoplasma TaxID=307134 RepID=A0ABT5LAY7_9MOLU|nr:hypothetical protein [Columbia Basin potato purple top phytoplasma]
MFFNSSEIISSCFIFKIIFVKFCFCHLSNSFSSFSVKVINFVISSLNNN